MEPLMEDELCFPHLSNISCKKRLQQSAENFFIYILLFCISLLTVTLNLLVIISISHFRYLQQKENWQLHTPTNLFLLSLAVSDFLVGLLLMPIQIIQTGGCWVFGSFTCGLFKYIAYIITSVSVGNMVLISADRYVAICDPLHYPNKVTLRKVKICVCLCWSCSVFYNGVILKDFLKNPDKYNLCYGECVFIIGYIANAIDLIITFLSPLTVIIFLYMRVFVVAVSQARAMRSHISAVSQQGSVCFSAKKSERKAATAVGVVVVVFVISFCPYFVSNFAPQEMPFILEFLTFTLILFYCNSCLNPIIYAFFYPWFRKCIKHIVTLQILQPDSCNAILQ